MAVMYLSVKRMLPTKKQHSIHTYIEPIVIDTNTLLDVSTYHE
jgi:hypothetical protein